MSQNPVITISRSLGSGGTEAGFLAARRLGWHFCDRRILRLTAEAMGSSISGLAGQEERQRALSRALARVVAHEIYHILAETTEHAGSGLAKAAQPLNDLVSKRKLEFATDDLRAIKEGGASSEPGRVRARPFRPSRSIKRLSLSTMSARR